MEVFPAAMAICDRNIDARGTNTGAELTFTWGCADLEDRPARRQDLGRNRWCHRNPHKLASACGDGCLHMDVKRKCDRDLMRDMTYYEMGSPVNVPSQVWPLTDVPAYSNAPIDRSNVPILKLCVSDIQN